ncbi:MAG TPA: HDOD domain-containing protein [Kofleriaceae bacterium]
MGATAGTKHSVLFVDDEPAILSGLKNLFRRDRDRWDIVVAQSGEQALAEMEKRAFTVVVSDMRMPGVDGATLLTAIKERSPQTVRIMLSGQADRDSIVRALPALHQLLSKPCDADVLRGVLERSMHLESLPIDDDVRGRIGRLATVPSTRSVFDAMTRALESSASTAEITEIVSRDPAMTAKVLQLVNSGYFGAGRATSSIESAVRYLGVERLRHLVSTASVIVAAEDPMNMQEAVRADSVRCAELTVKLLGVDNSHEAYVAGLLHDIGCLILAADGETSHLLERCAASESASGQATHAEIGACLLGIWGIPRRITDAVRAHHNPASAPVDVQRIAAAIHIADAYTCNQYLATGEVVLDREGLAKIALGDELAAWCEIAKKG